MNDHQWIVRDRLIPAADRVDESNITASNCRDFSLFLPILTSYMADPRHSVVTGSLHVINRIKGDAEGEGEAESTE